jgi:molybdopterin synthase catalytic subunit
VVEMNALRALTSAPLDVTALLAAAARAAEQAAGHPGAAGALSTFVGTVRGRTGGQPVRHLEYEAYEPMAVAALERITAEVAESWPGVTLLIHHRTGRVDPGEPSVVIVAASAHRADACTASRYAIERLKQIAPIWKREVLEDGASWVEGATADPEDEGARAEARRRACA